MDGIYSDLSRRYDPSKPLGYLNFSDGTADPRFRRLLADVFGTLVDAGVTRPWEAAGGWLRAAAGDLERSGAAAFRDTAQARAVLAAAFDRLPAAYRRHHADLLAHQPDDLLFNAFFLARGCEAALRERAAGTPPDRLADAALRDLNDYVGYRPIAVLETRPQTDYFPHEKVCPVPLYLAGAGVAPGPFADLVRPALDLLTRTDPALLDEACFAPDRMDELALDPRAVDHFHPVNKRPNMLFGEWDPHRIDNKGFYRRFVLRQPTLDALLRWVEAGPTGDAGERRFEAAAVLAGTVLMGAGISGAGPTHYDSSVTLASLVQRIARYRDEFYRRLMDRLPDPHGRRLRDEAARLKQPFAGVRHFLNATIASERALHLQERRLAVLFAAMGYPAAARERAARIAAPSARLAAEVRVRQTSAEFAAAAGRPEESLRLLGEAEDLLRRGIDCGAVIDPWNILGYQGLFPIFPGREDTVRDPRAEELILTAGRQFDRYAHALAAAATAGDAGLRQRVAAAGRAFAGWWDPFATTAVSDLPRVHGGERADAADHVADALALWRQGGAADPAFWRTHRDGFRTPAAFAQVIDALLDHGDYRAAMALLVTWLSEADQVPLQDPAASFFRLAARWLREAVAAPLPRPEKAALLRRFFELLEANADDRWEVPDLGGAAPRPAAGDGDGDDEDGDGGTYASAYEGVTFRDSADDGQEGAVADGGDTAARFGEFPLEHDAERFEDRLRFLAAVARLWRSAARPDVWPRNDLPSAAALGDWFRTARGNLARLRGLLDRLAAVPVPEPSAGLEGVMEYDRRRVLKGHLVELTVSTAVETAAAVRSLAAVLSRSAELPAAEARGSRLEARGESRPNGGKSQNEGDRLEARASSLEPAPWEAVAVRLERAVAAGDTAAARKLFPAFVALFRREPLLVSPPADGGPPAHALRAQTALRATESLLTRLPRLGLLRETYHLTRLARQMERNDPPDGRRVSSFDQLFRTAVVGVVTALVSAAEAWEAGGEPAADGSTPETDGEDGPLAPALRTIAESFHRLWLEHSATLRLSALETILEPGDWEPLKQFVRTYGGDLFTVRFLTLSNVRGILGQGVGAWLNRLADDPGEARPKLADDWADGVVDKAKAARHLETALQALVEHYDEYRDYNTTTTQSDYGENLYILLDFLRLKVAYDRYAWRLRPLVLAHEVLCRRGHDALAAGWRRFIAAKTDRLAAELLDQLAAREGEHGMKLRTVRDRLEERFVRPLAIDQAAARVATAARAAREFAPASDTDEARRGPESLPAFAALQAAVGPLAEFPAGVGLDVPGWLRRLEDELRRAKSRGDDPADGDDVPAPPLDFADLKQQLNDWEKPVE